MSSSVADAARLLQAGRIAEAEVAARALVARARSADALHLLGCVRFEAGAREEALALLDEAIALDPRDASFLNNRARILAAAGRLDDAVRDLRRALQLHPSFHAALVHLGQVLMRAGRAEEAAVALRKAMLGSREFTPRFVLGLAEMARGRPADAEAAFRSAIEIAPAHAPSHANLGAVLQRQGRAAEAIEALARALALDPELADAHVHWGNALETQGDLDGARQHYASALALAPDSPEPWLCTASSALELGRYAEAREAYGRALALRPGWADALYGLSLVDLREQRFAQGWRGYERRFDTQPPQAERRAIALPRYTRPDANRPRVAVWSEQGIGDQILFSTLLPDLRAEAQAVVEVDARLIEAYRRSVQGIEFVAARVSEAAFASCTGEIALGSLPSLYRNDRASFAAQPRALLRADGDRVDAIRRQLGEGRWIGFSWRSVQKGLRAGLASRKSVPIEAFASFARDAGARLLDLQYGDVDEERQRFDAAHPGLRMRLEGLDLFHDLEGVLAAIEACEAVVTTSNVTAHLAGALGKRATVVLPGGRSPFHYWDAVEDGRSLWYPSVRVANWDSVVLLRGVEPPTY